MGIVEFIWKLLLRKMCKTFKSRKCHRKSFFPGKKSWRCFFNGRELFSISKCKQSKSDKEVCIHSAREALQPIYVTEITRNFPTEILKPFASARYEHGEINLLGLQDGSLFSNSQTSVDSVDVSEMFAWVYSMDFAADNFPHE